MLVKSESNQWSERTAAKPTVNIKLQLTNRDKIENTIFSHYLESALPLKWKKRATAKMEGALPLKMERINRHPLIPKTKEKA